MATSSRYQSVPSLMTLAARRATQTPFFQFQRLPEPAQEEVYQELCTPEFHWSAEVDGEVDLFVVLNVVKLTRGVEDWHFSTQTDSHDKGKWRRLLRLVESRSFFQEEISNFFFFRQLKTEYVSVQIAVGVMEFIFRIPLLTMANMVRDVLSAFEELQEILLLEAI